MNNTAKARVPSKGDNWEAIDIYVFSNGQEDSPPRKYHLRSEDINQWESTISYLARSQYGPTYQSINLYTLDGMLIETPLELRNDMVCVAVEPSDNFIKASYEKYLMKASRSFEKRQSKLANIDDAIDTTALETDCEPCCWCHTVSTCNPCCWCRRTRACFCSCMCETLTGTKRIDPDYSPQSEDIIKPPEDNSISQSVLILRQNDTSLTGRVSGGVPSILSKPYTPSDIQDQALQRQQGGATVATTLKKPEGRQTFSGPRSLNNRKKSLTPNSNPITAQKNAQNPENLDPIIKKIVISTAKPGERWKGVAASKPLSKVPLKRATPPSHTIELTKTNRVSTISPIKTSNRNSTESSQLRNMVNNVYPASTAFRQRPEQVNTKRLSNEQKKVHHLSKVSESKKICNEREKLEDIVHDKELVVVTTDQNIDTCQIEKMKAIFAQSEDILIQNTVQESVTIPVKETSVTFKPQGRERNCTQYPDIFENIIENPSEFEARAASVHQYSQHALTDSNFIAVIDKGDVINLKLDIEIKTPKRQNSRSLTHILKGFQMASVDERVPQTKSLESLLGNESVKKHIVESHPKVIVIHCSCQAERTDSLPTESQSLDKEPKIKCMMARNTQRQTFGSHNISHDSVYKDFEVKKMPSIMSLETFKVIETVSHSPKNVEITFTTSEAGTIIMNPNTVTSQSEVYRKAFIKLQADNESYKDIATNENSDMIKAKFTVPPKDNRTRVSKCSRETICEQRKTTHGELKREVAKELIQEPMTIPVQLYQEQIIETKTETIQDANRESMKDSVQDLVSEPTIESIPKLESTVNSVKELMEEQENQLMIEPKSVKRQTSTCESRRGSDVKEEPDIKQKNITLVDKATQTEWSSILLEARQHVDGRYSFHIPPLSVLRNFRDVHYIITQNSEDNKED